MKRYKAKKFRVTDIFSDDAQNYTDRIIIKYLLQQEQRQISKWLDKFSKGLAEIKEKTKGIQKRLDEVKEIIKEERYRKG